MEPAAGFPDGGREDGRSGRDPGRSGPRFVCRLGGRGGRWAQLNRCTAAPSSVWVAEGVYEERYSGCADGADVAGRITVGGGHSWVADNDALWAFVSQFRRER